MNADSAPTPGSGVNVNSQDAAAIEALASRLRAQGCQDLVIHATGLDYRCEVHPGDQAHAGIVYPREPVSTFLVWCDGGCTEEQLIERFNLPLDVEGHIIEEPAASQAEPSAQTEEDNPHDTPDGASSSPKSDRTSQRARNRAKNGNSQFDDQFRTADFVDSMRDAGCDPGAEPIIGDGKIHRFRGPRDKHGHKNCWYVLYEYGGVFGSHRLGIRQAWRGGLARLSKDARLRLEQQIRTAQAKAEAELKQIHEAATVKARRLWDKAKPISDATEHEYLASKQIQPHGARLLGSSLCIPLSEDSNQIVSLQFIRPNGEKIFLTGGRVTGCYYLLSDGSAAEGS
jgi:hypothetical protein